MTRARVAALVAVALATLVGAASAETATSDETVGQPEGKVVAQAAPKATPRKAEPPADAASVADRVSALEKQGVVLSEDVGKARLEQRMQLEALAKRQAEAIAKLNQQLAEQQAQAEKERQKQATRNKYLWIAIGVLAVGVMAK